MSAPGKVVLSPRLPPVSRLAIGSLTVSPMQACLPADKAAQVLAYAFDSGINFVDTAQYYENYGIIRAALKLCKSPDSVIVSTKTYAYSRALAEEAVEDARRTLGRDVIDIFLLHEQESYNTMKGHMEAYEYLLECREKGIIRAVGASTHHVSLVRGLIRLINEGVPVDICHPLYNMAGIGIADGKESDMADAISELHEMGVGIFGMKSLGGGHLSHVAEDALSFVLSKPYIDSIAVGMQSTEEIDANLCLLETGSFSDKDRLSLSTKHRSLHIEDYCEGCGACVRRCGEGALRLEAVTEGERAAGESEFDFSAAFEAENGIVRHAAQMRAAADDSKCVRCGYCTKVCPVFALKIY